DAVAVLAYLADKLPHKSNDIFKQAENELVRIQVPEIAVGEVIYTILKGKEVFGVSVPVKKILAFLDVLEASKNMSIVNLSITGWRKVIEIDLPDLHDRMIVATHLTTDSQALLTDDDKIGELKGVEVIW
ncbi:MAG: PIN domain-containing protein, partial [Proteobacteria bacterium]|nr:PIN domain-containing protein [Pseudomonadota bacterium]